jgi:hypothetical protein
MGLFSSFRKNNNHLPEKADAIPESIVPASADSKVPSASGISVLPGNMTKGLDSVYAFLQFDYESKGYQDALTNPDESYKNDNISLIKHDFLILLDRTASWYETMLKETDFHISSRSRAGLIDLVEELKIRREITSSHLEKVQQIKSEALTGTGSSDRIVLSYQRGFMRGLYAISQSKLFNGNI